MTVVVRSLINESQTLDSVALPAWASQKRNASTAALAAAVVAKTIQMDEVNAEVDDGLTIQYYAPLTGTAITPLPGTECAIIDQAGTIAALTLNMPASPYHGQPFEVSFDEIVTALTMAAPASATIKAALTAATAKGYARWRYNQPDNTWYRFG